MSLGGASEQAGPGAGPPRGRVASIDLLRGAVMVLMVLDHTRDFLAPSGVDPTDVDAASPGLFWTRWVTHVCAPVFVLLAGASASLAGGGGGRPGLAGHLARRGLWLVVLELTVVKFGLFFNPALGIWPLLVFWAIGWSLVALAALIAAGLPARWIGLIGVVLIAGHNLADGVQAADLGAFGPAWLILHQQGPIVLPGGVVVFVAYPLIPWVGVVMAGYALGRIWGPGWSPTARRRLLVGLGLGLIALFAVLRGTNSYGDPAPWAPRADGARTVMAFLNVRKYPPSLLYLAMTLGPAFLLLAAADGRPLNGPVARALRTFGRVPLFYYLAQWYLIHTMAILLALAEGNSVVPFVTTGPFDMPPEYSHTLPVVYLGWLIAVALLYPASRWYDGRRRGPRAPLGDGPS